MGVVTLGAAMRYSNFFFGYYVCLLLYLNVLDRNLTYLCLQKGQLGHGDLLQRDMPTRVTGLSK
jgi:hypothetical protein